MLTSVLLVRCHGCGRFPTCSGRLSPTEERSVIWNIHACLSRHPACPAIPPVGLSGRKYRSKRNNGAAHPCFRPLRRWCQFGICDDTATLWLNDVEWRVGETGRRNTCSRHRFIVNYQSRELSDLDSWRHRSVKRQRKYANYDIWL